MTNHQKRDASLPLYADPVFRKICNLEDPLQDARGMAHALILIASSPDSPEWHPVHSLASQLLRKLEKIESVRGKLFHLTHPSREEFEKAGGVKKRQRQLRQSLKATAEETA